MLSGSALKIGTDVASTMANVNKAVTASSKKAMRDVGNAAKKRMLPAAGPPTGGDRRYSNMSRYNHGGRLDVTVSVRAGSDWALAFVGSKGPWKIAEAGASPHRVNHPGTARSQGRSAWSRAADPLIRELGTDVEETITDAVEDAFYA